MQGINSVQIDFGDGAGFRTLAKGSTVNIYYATEGVKFITAKISTANGIRIAKSAIEYKRPQTYSQPDHSLTFEVDPVYTDDDQYLGGSGMRIQNTVIPCEGSSFIEQMMCSLKPAAKVEVVNGCDQIFDKPIIVVEGFDPTGSIDINEMRRRLRQSGFIATMQGYGYDFVFVDFTRNTTYIENNAKVLEAVINWVNQTKTGTYKSTVIGFSMGGLISRWCLKDMEDRGLQHNVENYFSYDAPHQGANVVLGMQYIFQEIVRDMGWTSGELRELGDAFKSPAARQMLVTYADYDNAPFNWFPSLITLNPLRDAFAQRLQSKGYPQQTLNFGLAFGRGNNIPPTKNAGNGQQFTPLNPFGPQSDLFYGAFGGLLVNMEAEAVAVPENNIKATIAYYSFFGFTFRKIFGINILPIVTLRVRRFDYTGQYPYDDAPGSFEQTQTEFVRNWRRGLAAHPTTYGHDGHNFLATVSALDLQNQNYSASTKWQSSNMLVNIDNQIVNPGQVNGNTLANPALSPFQAVITGTSDCGAIGCTAEPYINENNNWVFPANNNLWNHYHNTDITFQFAHFIERNILNANPINCAGGNGLCNINSIITGPSLICTSDQYELINVPQNVNILWEMQNGKLAITNGQGTPVINVSMLSSGSEIVKVTLTNNCGASLSLTLPVTVGPPLAPSIIVLNYDRRCGTYLEAQSSTVASATGYVWNLNFGQVVEDGTDYFYVSPLIHNPQTGLTYYNYLSVQAKNACGTSEPSATSQFNVGPIPSTCGGGGGGCCQIQASPNPTSGSMTVETTDNSEFTRLRIVDKNGQIRKQYSYAATKKVTLNVSDLPADLYRVQVFINNQWASASFIKQ
jgi:hypothetical protein